MKLIIKKEQMQQASRKSESKCVFVHGGIKYKCSACGKEWMMHLELGVADNGIHNRPSQPCPFMIRCECGETAYSTIHYMQYPSVRPLLSGMRYFAYDNSGKDMACGIPSIYNTKSEDTE